MDITSKESTSEHSLFWHFEQRLGITAWKNLLSLPQGDRDHSQDELDLEHKLKFTFTREKAAINQIAKVFISDQTDFYQLSQFLPFIFEEYQVFLCAENLIQERLLALEQDEIFVGDNKATHNLSYLLEAAAKLDASDIHIESIPEGKRIRIRVDGKLQMLDLPEEIDEGLFIKVKLNAGMDIAKKRAPQDGHFPFVSDQGKKFDLRTSTIPGIYGEKIVIRMLPSTAVQFSMVDMGFNTEQIKVIQKQLTSKTGMILFTGPTGSGKTTSLYAIIKELMSEALNIITVEDPVEYRLNSITQVEVNELAGVSFSSALRSFLRQDPDVILIGEIRDQETAQIAARAAQTGHLVLSTLHSNSVFEAIHRLNNLGVANDDLASSLKLIVSQRLVAKLCSCRGLAECHVCNGKGFSGRIPLLEILPVTASIKKLLSYGHGIGDIEQQATRENFTSLRQQGLKLVDSGAISLDELNSTCPE